MNSKTGDVSDDHSSETRRSSNTTTDPAAAAANTGSIGTVTVSSNVVDLVQIQEEDDQSVRMMNVDVEAPIESNSAARNGSVDDDVRNFFLRPPVSTERVSEIRESVEGALQALIVEMEAKGPAVYQNYLQQQAMAKRRKEQSRLNATRKAQLRRHGSKESNGKESNGKDNKNNNDDDEDDDDDDEGDEEVGVSPSQVKELEQVSLDPRSYQTALLERAKKENIIVHLGTGTGKTFIALLLIQHYLELAATSSAAAKEGQDPMATNAPNDAANETSDAQHQKKPKQQIVFLVPSVALAYQQQSFLQTHLPCDVALACAYTVHRRAKLAAARVLVGTHGAYLDLLRSYRDLFSMDRVSLLILDECHHCTGRASYAILMKEFYHQASSSKPRVLGLTASPLINVKINHSNEQLAQQLADLEQRMDAVIVPLDELGLGDEAVDGKDPLLTQQAIEQVIPYNDQVLHAVSANDWTQPLERADSSSTAGLPPIPMAPLAMSTTILHNTRLKELRQLEQLHNDLGALPTRWYCQTLIRELARNVYEGESVVQFQAALDWLKQIAASKAQTISDKLLRLETSLIQELQPTPSPPSLQLNQIAGTTEPTDQKVGVVFVQRRITALALKHYFNRKRQQLLEQRLQNPPPEDMDVDEKTQADSKDDPGQSVNVAHDQFADADDDSTAGYFENPVLTTRDSNSSTTVPAPSTLDKKTSSDHTVSVVRCCSMIRKSNRVFRTGHSNSAHLNPDADEAKSLLHEQYEEEQDVKTTLNGLRQGTHNVLIATSVVEEGVDLQSCAFVFVFDALATIKSYIQMKGRARQKNAKFYLFAMPNRQQPLNLADARQLEERVIRFVSHLRRLGGTRVPYSQRDPHLNQIQKEHLGNISSEEWQAVEAQSFSTDIGTVALDSAKSKLFQFALCQPIDVSTRSSKRALQAYLPLYDGECNRLSLPASCGSELELRLITLPKSYHEKSKKEKQSCLALIACVRLYRQGLLSDRLLPFSRQEVRSRMISLTPLDVQDRPLPVENTLEQLQDLPQQDKVPVYVYAIRMSGSRIDRARAVFGSQGQALAVCFFEPQDIATTVTFDHDHAEFGRISCRVEAVQGDTAKGGEISPVVCSRDELKILWEFFALVLNARWKRRTKSTFFAYPEGRGHQSVIAPYALGCINRDGQLDWAMMQTVIAESQRSTEDLTKLAQSVSLEEPLSRVRLWCPSHDPLKVYIAFGPTKKKLSSNLAPSHVAEGLSTYQDFFSPEELKIRLDDPMFHCQRLWQLPNRRGLREQARPMPCNEEDPGTRPTCDFLRSVLLPISLCRELPVADPVLALESILLPQALHLMERYMTAKAFLRHCRTHLPRLAEGLTRGCTIQDVAQALTASSCVGEDTYERWEWLGDGVLEVVCTEVCLKSDALRKWVRGLHEGDLDIIRSTMCRNIRLEALCRAFAIDRFLITSTLSRGLWTPTALALQSPSTIIEKPLPRGKVLADTIEAFLGVVYLKCGGYDMALKVAEELRLTIPWDPNAEYADATYTHSVQIDESEAAVTNFTGYGPFRNKKIVVEAFTHPTSLTSNVASYQRLEWIGDAALCLAAREWIYNQYPNAEVKDLVLTEEILVCNQTLAFISCKHGIYKHLRHHDQTLPGRIDEYFWKIREAGRGLWGAEPPKALADAVESAIGAVYVDGGFQAGQAAALKVLEPVLTLFENRRNDQGPSISAQACHPKRKLQELGGTVMTISSNLDDVASLQVVEAARQPNQRDAVATIQLLGKPILSSKDISTAAATNRACSYLVAVLEDNPRLAKRFKSARRRVLGNQQEMEQEMRGLGLDLLAGV